jgi:hypothetical protein
MAAGGSVTCSGHLPTSDGRDGVDGYPNFHAHHNILAFEMAHPDMAESSSPGDIPADSLETSCYSPPLILEGPQFVTVH